MRGDLSRQYEEMRSDGYDPFVGLRPLLVVIVVLVAVAAVLAGFAVTGAFHFWHQIHPVVHK